MTHPNTCPKCGSQVVGVEYAPGSKYRYDGVSEWACVATMSVLGEKVTCDWRIGRWCGQQLAANEVEPKFCERKHGHPRVFNLND